MTVTEKVAYLKGLMEGLDFKADTNEGKIIAMMADVLESLALEVTDMQDDIADINEYLEAVDEDLTTVEEELFCDCDCDCDCDDDCEDGCCSCCGEDEDCYEVECPHCGEIVEFDELPENAVIACTACGKDIPLDEE